MELGSGLRRRRNIREFQFHRDQRPAGFNGSGTCARTSTYFTQFVFTSSSGGTLGSSTLYALHTGDVLIVPPTLSSDVEPIFMVAPDCPVPTRR